MLGEADEAWPASARGAASISACGTYRWTLERRWADLPFVLWIMLNPSTADGGVDDPTVRRCIGFSKAWGYGGLTIANLYAARTPYPEALRALRDPVGPDNDDTLRALAQAAGVVVAAWGAHPLAPRRVATVLPLLNRPVCLGTTAAGHPRHPLYVRGTTRPSPYPAGRIP